MTTIQNFQQRFAFVNADGTLTLEASRMLRDWFARIGGANATDLTTVISLLDSLTSSVNDDKIELAFDPNTAAIAALRQEIAELRQMLEFNQPPANTTPDVYTSVF